MSFLLAVIIIGFCGAMYVLVTTARKIKEFIKFIKKSWQRKNQ